MDKFNIKKQINRLYMVTTVGYFQIAGASWVALLALRGFSIIEIGILESIFHIVSFCFEIPSGVVSDVFGRKKTLVLSQVVSMVSSILMILSTGFWTVAFAIGFNALSYNLSSGAVSTLILFFLQAKLPIAGLDQGLLGTALFVMGLGAALDAKMVSFFPKSHYSKILIISGIGISVAFVMSFVPNPYIMALGGFIGAFSDDFIQVRTDVILNNMIPSEQRATLVSVSSFIFSVVMIVMSTLMGFIMG